MRTEDTFLYRFFQTLRYHRWLMIMAFTAMLTGLELVRSHLSTLYDFDQAYRVLLFGIALPLLAGIALSIPAGFEKTHKLVKRTRKKMTRRVMVGTTDMLLGAGIESLLNRQEELDLVEVIFGNSSELLAEIKRLKPEVIILDEMIYPVVARELLAFLNDWPEMRLVVVSVSENRVQIYNKRQILVTQSTDLVEMMCQT